MALGRIAIITAHAGSDSLEGAIASWGGEVPVHVVDGNDGMLRAYDRAWREFDYDILAYFHDDLIITEPGWVARVLREFDDLDVGVVGFGGALQHGSPDLYKEPYDYHQLGRSLYLSNVEDWKIHGSQEEGARDVAVLDGFALIVRRNILEMVRGWPLDKIDYIGYDYWISCMAHRLGYRIKLTGVRCLHLGGRTFVLHSKLSNEEKIRQYEGSHKFIYNEFPDVLPYGVEA